MKRRQFTSVMSRSGSILIACLALGVPIPVAAQEYSLFDKFSAGIGVSSLGYDTRIRLDSKDLGIGTGIDFETDLGLSDSEGSATLALEWQVGRKHRLYAVYSGSERDSIYRIDTDIQFGDLVIPIQAEVTAAFDIKETGLGYHYYPWVKDRWALGFGIGFRILDVTLGLGVSAGDEQSVTESAEVTGPLPAVGIDYRYGITPKWRLRAGFGWLDLEIGDFKGSQTLVAVGIEHLVARHFSWGADASFSAVDVEVDASKFLGAVLIDISQVGVFVKARW